MNRDERRTLRREAASALARVQALPGFGVERENLPAVPERARTWRWFSVLLVTEGAPPGAIRWGEHDLSQLPKRQQIAALEEIDAHGEINARVSKTPDGKLIARLPVCEPTPKKDELDVLIGYREAVERFAAAYLFGAQWSARAVHGALCRGCEVQVPPGLPEGWAAPPLSEPITLDPASPMSRTDMRRLGQALVDAGSVPGVAELRQGREMTWERAVEATRKRLSGERTTGTERAALRHARRYLNAVVNGELDADPLEPSDDPEWAVTEAARLLP